MNKEYDNCFNGIYQAFLDAIEKQYYKNTFAKFANYKDIIKDDIFFKIEKNGGNNSV